VNGLKNVSFIQTGIAFTPKQSYKTLAQWCRYGGNDTQQCRIEDCGGAVFVLGRTNVCGPGSSVGIVTGYGLDARSGDRIPVGGESCRTCHDRPWDPHSLLYSGYRVFPGGTKRPGRDADPSPPSSAEV
jgi:hypothetical protein